MMAQNLPTIDLPPTLNTHTHTHTTSLEMDLPAYVEFTIVHHNCIEKLYYPYNYFTVDVYPEMFGTSSVDLHHCMTHFVHKTLLEFLMKVKPSVSKPY